MSKKRGETKMIDVARAVADVAEYDRLGKTVYNDVRNLVLTTQEPRSRSRTFTAKPCTLCTALRGPGTNFTRVYASRGNVRYCKCHYCNNTWKDSDS